jgi:hypothetical protein
MADIPTCVWTGKSGTRYTYWVYPLPATFEPNQLGNYIYTRKDSQGYWQPIYIGQGDLNDRANNHHQAACIRQKGATHFHCHKNATEQARLVEERDLLANYTQAYVPTGCNERLGG